MNTTTTTSSSCSADELHDARPDDMSGARLQLTDVRGRARSIRRTRIAVGAVGAAAAVVVPAVIAPALVVGMDSQRRPAPTVHQPDGHRVCRAPSPTRPGRSAHASETSADGEPRRSSRHLSDERQLVSAGGDLRAGRDYWAIASYDDGCAMRVSVVDGTAPGAEVVRRRRENPDRGAASAGTAVAWLRPGRRGAGAGRRARTSRPCSRRTLPGRLELNRCSHCAATSRAGGVTAELPFDSYTDQGSET